VGFNAGQRTNSTSYYNYYISIINTFSSQTHIRKINNSKPSGKTDKSELKTKKKELKIFFSFL